MFPPFSLVGWVLAKMIRDMTEWVIYSGARLVNSILVPSTNAEGQPRATMFSTITKKYDAYTQTLWELSTTSETSVNGNQGNATTIKILKASLR